MQARSWNLESGRHIDGRASLVIVVLLLLGCSLHRYLAYQLVVPDKEIARSQQMVLVRVPDWSASAGTIDLCERSLGGKWTKVHSFPGVVGKNGLGWGIGLHGTGRLGEPHKREGDGRAPAGVFRLNSCVGIATSEKAEVLHFPYHQITETTVAVYDSRSTYYNRVVDRNAVAQVDWSSAEKMRSNGLYRWVVIVEHNWKPYPGFGSCIFLHLWQRPGVPTIGCTAMSLDNLELLIHWLDAKKHPLLVQLPEPTYVDLKQQWSLP
ncbi:MAG TPA: hypothetical protein VE242_03170 [Chthoniobacterales bacterium]|nr:hypothetical protein [Chthoniobacterales bacterium]